MEKKEVVGSVVGVILLFAGFILLAFLGPMVEPLLK